MSSYGVSVFVWQQFAEGGSDKMSLWQFHPISQQRDRLRNGVEIIHRKIQPRIHFRSVSEVWARMQCRLKFDRRDLRGEDEAYRNPKRASGDPKRAGSRAALSLSHLPFSSRRRGAHGHWAMKNASTNRMTDAATSAGPSLIGVQDINRCAEVEEKWRRQRRHSDYDAVTGPDDLMTCQDGCLLKSDMLQYRCVRFIRAVQTDDQQSHMARLKESGQQTRDAVQGLEAWCAQNSKAWLDVPKACDDYEDDDSAACQAALQARDAALAAARPLPVPSC